MRIHTYMGAISFSGICQWQKFCRIEFNYVDAEDKNAKVCLAEDGDPCQYRTMESMRSMPSHDPVKGKFPVR